MTTADQPVQIDVDGDDDDEDCPHILLADQIMTTNMICIREGFKKSKWKFKSS